MDLLDRDRGSHSWRESSRPNAFKSVLTFTADGAATRIVMHTVFPTKALRDEAQQVPRNRGRPADPGQLLAAYVAEILLKGARN